MSIVGGSFFELHCVAKLFFSLIKGKIDHILKPGQFFAFYKMFFDQIIKALPSCFVE